MKTKKAYTMERTQSHDWAVSIPGVRALQRIGSRRRHESTSVLSKNKPIHKPSSPPPPPPNPTTPNSIRVAQINSNCPAMKDDSRFQKYWNMKVLGFPDSVIITDIQKDGLDSSIWDFFDWGENYEEQQRQKQQQKQQQQPQKLTRQKSQIRERQPSDSRRSSNGNRDAAPSIKDKNISRLDDKYCSMTVVGLAADDASVTCDDFPIMKDDPRFDKYWKMKVVGVPDGAVRNAIRRDGQNEAIWDLDWDKNYESQIAKLKETSIIQAVKANESRIKPVKCRTPPMKEDSRFQKYWKMNDVGVPHGAILNAIARDGLDASIWNMDWDKNYEEQLSKPPPMARKPPLVPKKSSSLGSSNSSSNSSRRPIPMKDDSRFDRYWKMKAVGVPIGAIQIAMRRDGWDASVLFDTKAWEMNYEAQLIQSQTKKEERPAAWDLKANMSGLSSKSTKSIGRSLWKNHWASSSLPVTPNHKDPTIRRKKIFWRPIDPRQIKANSLWSLVQSRSISLLSFDSTEFNELFTEPITQTNQQQRNKKMISSSSVAAVKPKPKRAVQVIDVKRSMNGGIVLARLRLEYEKIATIIGTMEHGHFDATQLKALKEFLPTDDERHLLQMYMCREDVAFSYLSECEKYMFTMMHVAGAHDKLDCMLFREQFNSRFNDLVTSIQTLQQACDEVKNSESLREILGIILIVVNRMNTGGAGNGAVGFSLEALLKLNETKAFDKKTSVLHYLVKLVKRNNASLLDFYKDLSHVALAKNIAIDSLLTEIRDMKKEIEAVHKTAQKHTNQLSGVESKYTLKRIMQQITPLRNLSGVTHYNQTDHVTENMCPVERFTVNAAASTETAFIMTQDVKEKYSNLLEYLGEAEEMASNDCFGTIERFITEFCRAADQVQKDEKAMKYKLRKAANTAKNFLGKRKDQITDKITVIDLSPITMVVDNEDTQWEENSLLECTSGENIEVLR